MTAPVQRPSIQITLTDLHKRVRNLEAIPGGVGFWRFDYNNQGGWGYLQFNDSFDLDLLPDPLSVGGSWGAAIEDASGAGLLIGSTTGVLVKGQNVAGISTESYFASVLTFGSGPSGAGIYLETRNGYDLKAVVDGDYVLSGTGVFGLSTDSTITLATTSIDINLSPAGALNALAPSGVFLNLPLAPGTSGSLYSNGGVVTVSP